MKTKAQGNELVGLGLAIAILLCWFISVFILLTTPIATLGISGILSGIALRTFFHTGLFILAHDAMHGNLVPNSPNLNQAIGELTITLYACLSYESCRQNHIQHHKFPAQAGDPDFHDGVHTNPLIWFGHFIGNYFSLKYLTGFSSLLLGMAVGFNFFGIGYTNLIYFVLLPLCLSTAQLFFFGTYLPHGIKHRNAVRKGHNSALVYFWSLISCYHFGFYHEEHHAFPCQSWFELPYCSPP